MSVTQLQQRIIDKQTQLVELQSRLAALAGELEAQGGEWNPNTDEALLAYFDAGQKTIDAVETLLHKLEAKIG